LRVQRGYPWEGHKVLTKDGYQLTLHRLPRKHARQAAFFVHGVMDTALGWVCTSVTESLAFGAWTAGYDVWLASCRNNPPRCHVRPDRHSSSKYFAYSVNEIALLDLGAQVRSAARLVPCRLRRSSFAG
jgi:lysosomal acid lipase/cholesteryl ester hydrolase